MYADTDFILALIKEDDWLSEAAEKLCKNKSEEIWTRDYALIELMIISYREDRDVFKTITRAIQLFEINGRKNEVISAAKHVSEEGYTPFDALHLVSSGEYRIISSDKSYDKHSERLKLEELADTDEEE